MPKQLIKGNEAIVKAAILAGCKSYYGYPITPASEVAEAASYYFPRCGGTFIQAESEVAAIYMCYGAAGAGERTMTASSGPGVSLMQEGLSYSACAELPMVVADVARAGPGLGNLGPEQGDYNQVVKGGGHGNYKLIVLAPASCQEMCDLTLLAFELSDRYRNPALILTEGFCGQMMEPVEFPREPVEPPDKTSWAVSGTAETRRNVVSTDIITFDALEAHLQHLQSKYAEMEEKETRAEEYRLDDAEVVAVAYGTLSRVLRSAVDAAREDGIKAGLLRPITLFPFPSKRMAELAQAGKPFLVTELSNGQMVDDVRLAVNGRVPVTTHFRMGGNMPSIDDLVQAIRGGGRGRDDAMSDTEYVVFKEQPRSFFEEFDRKPAPHNTTHYCPGCGHGVLHKIIAEAIDELGVQDRAILVTPVGCSCFAYWYFDVGNQQSAHGRAPAVATGAKRQNPDAVVMTYQGDGDIAAIGTAEIIHAANRGENISVFFVNNAIYGMTGGQMAPTSLEGQATTTSPLGRSVENEGHPILLAEMLAGLESTAYIERTSLHDWKNTNRTRKAVRKALQAQLDGKGFSMVEVLSTCPTAWKMTPVDSGEWLAEHMIPVFPLGVKKDVTEHKPASPKRRREIDADRIATLLNLPEQDEPLAEKPTPKSPVWTDPRIKIAGFGGQGVLLMGLAIAQAGLLQGQNVTWLPSYGPEMRGGTANIHVNVSDGIVGSPVVDRPSVLVAMNRPSLDKFGDSLVPGGLLILNSSIVDGGIDRDDVTVVKVPANEIAGELGNMRASNMVMFGAFAEATGVLSLEACHRALDGVVKHKKFIELNAQAIVAGAKAVSSSV